MRRDNYPDTGGDTQGIARIQCTNPDCKHECFRPFSCKSFYFCPSCSQKRTLLFSEYMNERLLLALPHRQSRGVPRASKEPCFSLGVLGVVAGSYGYHGICSARPRMSGTIASIASKVATFEASPAQLRL